ncbi:MAG: nucleoside-diphosphate sugar epimerase/dehydratase [Thermodesulfovibrionales bacterium]|nr:nucleoside-diphosphate sugar epimerase/dehydratase [Thermodesulfovibrionales bacterium]
MPSLLYPSLFKRSLFFILSDILIIILSLYLSFLLRFEFALADEYRLLIAIGLPFFIIVKLAFFGLFRLYRITWRHVGINELFNIVNALIVAQLVLIVLFLVPSPLNLFALIGRFSDPISTGFPRSIFLIDWGISILLISGLRISKRLYLEIVRKKRNLKQGLRTIIIGAGNTGEMVLRDITKQEVPLFYPVGFLDDDGRKLGTYIHGVKILAKTDKLKAIVKKHATEALIIAVPSLSHKDLRRMYDDARECGIKTIKIVPRIYDFHKPDINLKKLEEIRIEDLIGRQTVKVDYGEIEKFLKGRVILITGAGGSIGSEIIMQVCGFYPERMILFEIDETELHNIALKLKQSFPYLFEKISFVVGDIRDTERVNEVIKTFKPQIVFHAAAYKHVPMMEYNPDEAVKVNIFGTYNTAKTAAEHAVEKFIMISTDKAVRPTSVMGATKRVAEYICTALDDVSSRDKKDNGKTEFISVRFGNVLGSRGSVLPLFLDQLKYGGPLTVTHKDMRRYFMTVPEAVSLVLQASVIGKAGDVLALDMGEPVKIVELAEELIRIHGMEPYKDVDIEFIGLRPGEKLFEEILTAEEGTVASKHERIFIAKNSEKYSMEAIENILKEFEGAIKESPAVDGRQVRDLLKKYVRHFNEN